MQTFRQVYSRKEERQNLRSIGFCVLVVFTLVAGAFTLVCVKQLLDSPSMGVYSERASTEAEPDD